MHQNFGASVHHLWDGSDQATHVLCTIRLQFIDPELIMPSLTDDIKRDLFQAMAPPLQELADSRFGTGVVRVSDAGIRAGSLLAFVSLVAMAGAVWTFFKDYEDVRKGVQLFVADVQATGLKLLKLVRETYIKAAAQARRGQQDANRGAVSQ